LAEEGQYIWRQEGKDGEYGDENQGYSQPGQSQSPAPTLAILIFNYCWRRMQINGFGTPTRHQPFLAAGGYR
jgi:hypothetical protein